LLRSWITALAFFAGSLFPMAGYAGGSLPEVILSSHRAARGDILFLRVRSRPGEAVKVLWMEREIPLAARGEGEWCGFLGIDLGTAPKGYPLKVQTNPSGKGKSVEIRVEGKDYGERRITVPKEMVELDPPTLERVKKEAAEMKAVLDAPPADPLWDGPFGAPLKGELTGSFGRRNFINGQARSPHSGVDLKADLGMPVRAMNKGRVVLTCNQFFSGLSVVIDHGGGIHSMYFHLEKILVKNRQQVGRGDIIGHAGSTGRSTGPHLHLGVRVNGARVDPLRLIALSKELE
jgi:murein DD-endopeptidase MepM/ murein hydrolase activator NlpD